MDTSETDQKLEKSFAALLEEEEQHQFTRPEIQYQRRAVQGVSETWGEAEKADAKGKK
ncbi:hypothetical protein [Deinococcus alpinitundrae]|uniref:hypothetical protein n=1 Tax=Deinococcus alpinitundrae TaxID=468913 RepID=UPI00137A67D6|nr:hypothetical protein [Deinococcus alpinitundrae]